MKIVNFGKKEILFSLPNHRNGRTENNNEINHREILIRLVD